MAVIDNNTIMSQPYSYGINGTNIKSIPISSNKIFVIYQDNSDNICRGIIVTNTNTVLTKTEPVNIFSFDLGFSLKTKPVILSSECTEFLYV